MNDEQHLSKRPPQYVQATLGDWALEMDNYME